MFNFNRAVRSRAFSSASAASGAALGRPRKPGIRAESGLLKRLTGLGARGGSVWETLNQYLSEQNCIEKYEVESTIKEFRKFGKFTQALEVIEWMEMKNLGYSRAMRLDLVFKSKGIASADDYMRNLPPHEQNRCTYGALLNCYCTETAEQKACEIFEEMTQLGFVTTSLPFDNLMTMYLKLRNYEKVRSLAREMRNRNIFFSTYTYNLLMKGLAGLNDIDGVERVLKRLELADYQRINWTTYRNLATIYVNAGLFEKAKLSLWKLEETMKPRTREVYHFLLQLYATIGQSDEVRRVWKYLNRTHPGVNNMSYLAILQAHDKLNDLEGLRERFQEWLSRYSWYDIRLAHVVVTVFLRNNLCEEAMSVFEDAGKRTNGPFVKMREIFMLYFLENRRPDLALSYLEANIHEDNFKRGEELVTAFLNYFERERDVEGAERVLDIMKPLYRPNSADYQTLLRIYIAAEEKHAPEMRSRLEMDGIEINSEVEELLQKVCP